jgi:hypothetical protein
MRNLLCYGIGISLFGICSVNAAIAQPQTLISQISQLSQISQPSKKSITLFQNLTLSTKFTPDPQTLSGISGGTEEMQKQSGAAKTETGSCIGFIDSTPDHQIILSTTFDYLQLKVSSTGDTVLLIKGPGGAWCNDDQISQNNQSDRNPEITGAWLAGTYQVWVGSYEAKASFPYLLEISQQQLISPKDQGATGQGAK